MFQSPPPAAGPPITRAEFDALARNVNSIMTVAQETQRRQVRTETRLMRLLEHHGLNAQGQPVTTRESTTP